MLNKQLPTFTAINKPSEDKPSGKIVAIACSTGGFKGVFLHGVLSAFERNGFRVGAYGAASSSVIPAAAAAVNLADAIGLDYWLEGLQTIQQPGLGMSEMILAGLDRTTPEILPQLFARGSPRFLIATSLVDEAGAIDTQGPKARRRGRQLLLDAARGNRSWIESHLKSFLFDTLAEKGENQLSKGNFKEVAYASTRMLHAWDIPAWVGKLPFVDAYYTNACPAEELIDLGYELVVALSSEPFLFKDIFQQDRIDERQDGKIKIIHPDIDPRELGVSYTTGERSGIQSLYDHGISKGQEFITQFF